MRRRGFCPTDVIGALGKEGSKMPDQQSETILDAVEIQRIIPHRYPFLLVDRIVELEAGKRAVGIKNVTMGDGFFQGHFPDYPVMPGVLIVEAIAQAGAVAILTTEELRGRMVFFAGIDNVRFKRQVKPGDTLRLEVEMGQLRRGIGTGSGTATVDGELACKADLMFAIAPSSSTQ
jgi:3-hydroxyacyl-[acyl-carrier-protein] dehydratase